MLKATTWISNNSYIILYIKLISIESLHEFHFHYTIVNFCTSYNLPVKLISAIIKLMIYCEVPNISSHSLTERVTYAEFVNWFHYNHQNIVVLPLSTSSSYNSPVNSPSTDVISMWVSYKIIISGKLTTGFNRSYCGNLNFQSPGAIQWNSE